MAILKNVTGAGKNFAKTKYSAEEFTSVSGRC